MSTETTASEQHPAGDAAALRGVGIIIPAWQPENVLVDVVSELVQRGFERIVVVDDGSGPEFAPVFQSLLLFPQVALLRHQTNRGKGSALKTGFRFLLVTPANLGGVVTADADGQHRPEDIEHVARALLQNGTAWVLGSRRFPKGIPSRSRFGNELTRRIFRVLTGCVISDTQTGLRGLPIGLLQELIALPGGRYEYEMRMLAHLCRSGTRMVEVPIATVYLHQNRGSHFKPLRDSARIYLVLLGALVSRIKSLVRHRTRSTTR